MVQPSQFLDQRSLRHSPPPASDLRYDNIGWISKSNEEQSDSAWQLKQGPRTMSYSQRLHDNFGCICKTDFVRTDVTLTSATSNFAFPLLSIIHFLFYSVKCPAGKEKRRRE
ncbi:unnamed protein product [Protopolystoma xenopodis]|uniref:Uncharacterized protein n=1 Tax=Protopolystoma xenopodis TaxID=117903 RepID=A0A3S4ZYX0_9PLAT|nr:unnamed protein product [Protopolystoma xenopodis]